MYEKKTPVYDRERLSDLKERYFLALGANAPAALRMAEDALIWFAGDIAPDAKTRERILRLAERHRARLIGLVLRIAC